MAAGNKCVACGQWSGKGHKCPTVKIPANQRLAVTNVYSARYPNGVPDKAEIAERVSRAAGYKAEPLIYRMVDEFGASSWWNDNGELHREGGLPAYIGADGTGGYWYKNGQLHNEEGPAAVSPYMGENRWALNGETIPMTEHPLYKEDPDYAEALDRYAALSLFTPVHEDADGNLHHEWYLDGSASGFREHMTDENGWALFNDEYPGISIVRDKEGNWSTLYQVKDGGVGEYDYGYASEDAYHGPDHLEALKAAETLKANSY